MGKFIDLTGMRFGRLVVLKRSPDAGKGAKWICRCDCGNTTAVYTAKLKNGHTQSCGCLQKETAGSRYYKDLTGLTFGRLKVLHKASSTKYGRSRFECQCDCGNVVTVRGQSLINGTTKSCGVSLIRSGPCNQHYGGREVLKGGEHMPREKPHYQETLVGIRARAAELYPGQLLFGPTKVAKLLGKSRGWVWQHYGSFRDLTVEQIASLIC